MKYNTPAQEAKSLGTLFFTFFKICLFVRTMCAVLQRQNRFAAPLLGGASDARAPGREEQVAFPLRRPERMLFPARWVCAVWQLSSVRSARGFAQAKPESSPAAR